MTFILPGKVSGDSVCLPWHIWQQPTTESPSLAVRWFELSLFCRRPEDARMQPGETLAESAMIIVPGGQELEYDVDVDEDVVHFNVVSEPGRRLNFTPELEQLT